MMFLKKNGNFREGLDPFFLLFESIHSVKIAIWEIFHRVFSNLWIQLEFFVSPKAFYVAAFSSDTPWVS